MTNRMTLTYKYFNFWKYTPTEELPDMLLEWRDVAIDLLYVSGADHVMYYTDAVDVKGNIVFANFMLHTFQGDDFDQYVKESPHFHEIASVHLSDKPLTSEARRHASTPTH